MVNKKKQAAFLARYMGGANVEADYGPTVYHGENSKKPGWVNVISTEIKPKEPIIVVKSKVIDYLPIKQNTSPYKAPVVLELLEDDETKCFPKLPPFFNEKSNVQLTGKGLKKQDDYKFCCSCEGGCIPASCLCYQMNKQLNGESYCVIRKGKIASINNGLAGSGDTAIVACGKDCACHPDNKKYKEGSFCNHNIDKISISSQLEVYCNNPKMGYCVRTKTAVECGRTLLGELNGLVSRGDDDEVNDENQEYAMELIAANYIDDFAERLKNLPLLKDKPLENILEDLGSGHFVQTYSASSLMRLVGHSCLPNVATVRVAAGSMHPSFFRIFYISMHPIAAKTDLSIHYGLNYLKRYIKPSCLCGSSICIKPNGRILSATKDTVSVHLWKAKQALRKYFMSEIQKVHSQKNKAITASGKGQGKKKPHQTVPTRTTRKQSKEQRQSRRAGLSSTGGNDNESSDSSDEEYYPENEKNVDSNSAVSSRSSQRLRDQPATKTKLNVQDSDEEEDEAPARQSKQFRVSQRLREIANKKEEGNIFAYADFADVEELEKKGDQSGKNMEYNSQKQVKYQSKNASSNHKKKLSAVSAKEPRQKRGRPRKNTTISHLKKIAASRKKTKQFQYKKVHSNKRKVSSAKTVGHAQSQNRASERLSLKPKRRYSNKSGILPPPVEHNQEEAKAQTRDSPPNDVENVGPIEMGQQKKENSHSPMNLSKRLWNAIPSTVRSLNVAFNWMRGAGANANNTDSRETEVPNKKRRIF